jgi:16S rRNA (guanine527-N7)-methyltransferase
VSADEEAAELARALGVPLTADLLAKGQAYLDLLKSYNEKTNLTAETDCDSLWLRHLADGFPAAAFLKKLLGAPTARIADFGAGGGFIGFGLKLAWPEAEVTLIETLQRKYDFLNLAAVRSGMKGLRVVKARVGAASAAKTYDAVVERAQAQLPAAVTAAASLLGHGGIFVAYQSEAPNLDDERLRRALDRSGMRFLDIMPYRLPREDKERRLAAFKMGD